MIIATIAGIILTIALGYYAIDSLNRYADSKYGYEPINTFTIGMVAIPYGLLLIAGFLSHKHPHPMEDPNVVAALWIVAASNLIVILVMVFKTSLSCTLVAWPLMQILSVLLLLYFILMVLGSSNSQDRNRNNQY